ncbi:MAG: hypothetical protein V2I62_12055 [Bacteroidales bacterium]|jgi:hypothetical protein|nr:hypothetical protein [Bacteroidales bacterium]
MNSKTHRKPPHSWFLPILVFAFVWLLMGELISIHQRAIFNFYVFDQHPFSTPDKSGKDKVFKLKTKKSSKDQVEIDHHLTPCLTDNQPGILLVFSDYTFTETLVFIIPVESLRLKASRAPPVS